MVRLGFLFTPLTIVFLAVRSLAAAPATLSEVQQALSSQWVGTLEYRDYSEPSNSTKRVKLPTWLTVETTRSDLRFQYVYDDGPSKTVTETSLVRMDPSAGQYMIVGSDGKVEESYTVAGFEKLQQGRGTLILTGKGTENKMQVEVRTTLRIGRNLLEITRETAAAGQPMTFRHAYTLVRSVPPGSK